MRKAVFVLLILITTFIVSGCLVQIELELRYPPTYKYYSYIENKTSDNIRVVITSRSSRDQDRVYPQLKPGERVYPELPDGNYELRAIGYYDNRNYGSISFYASSYERWRILIYGVNRIRFEK